MDHRHIRRGSVMIPDNVSRGAELLDKNRPDWWLKIDLEKLDMESCCYCILGQLFLTYGEALRRLNIHSYDEDFGFDGNAGAGRNLILESLDLEWRALIAKRRHQYILEHWE